MITPQDYRILLDGHEWSAESKARIEQAIHLFEMDHHIAASVSKDHEDYRERIERDERSLCRELVRIIIDNDLEAPTIPRTLLPLARLLDDLSEGRPVGLVLRRLLPEPRPSTSSAEPARSSTSSAEPARSSTSSAEPARSSTVSAEPARSSTITTRVAPSEPGTVCDQCGGRMLHVGLMTYRCADCSS